jgi:RHS repeat-associated protein
MIFGNRMLIYDEMCRLTKASPKSRTTAQLPEDVVNHHTEVYSYDPVGNRLTGPKSTDSYTYDSGNEQLTYKGKLLLLDTGDQNEYDVNGNLIKKTQTLQGKWKIITTYAYDDENRLIKVTIQRGDHIKAVTFTYDHFGRRISKTVEREELDDDNNIIDKLLNKLNCPRTTYYIYDEQNIIAEYDDNGKQTATYIHGPNIDEPLAAEIRNSRIYYHADGLGSITTLTNHMGYKVQQYDYDSFGNIKSTPFWIKQPYTYTGREFDYETGLYYYRARYYDPKAGRFVTRDPSPLTELNYDQINLYVYAINNPILYTDPSGLNIHGNWCGPGGSGPAKDGVDTICMNHDKCYDKSGATWRDNLFGTKDKNKNMCIVDCDKQLCEDLKKYQPKTKDERKGRAIVARYFGCKL